MWCHSHPANTPFLLHIFLSEGFVVIDAVTIVELGKTPILFDEELP
jgi:hypothetical protein